MRSFSPVQPPATRIAALGAATPFAPSDISGLQQWAVDSSQSSDPYNATTIDRKYYLSDYSTENTHLGRQGRCWLFDGTNDYALGSTDDFQVGSFTASFWIKRANSALHYALSKGNDGLALAIDSLNRLAFGTAAGTVVSATNSISVGTWQHITVIHDASLSGFARYIVYLNGSALATTTSGTYTALIAQPAIQLNIGRRNNGTAYLSGCLNDLRIYGGVAKSASEVAAIYNQSRNGGDFDTTGLLACYPCNEESGTVGFDISGNGHHLTLSGPITEATFHATDSSITYNPNNEVGYRLSGSVYIPKRLSDSNAADGNALTVTGRCAHPVEAYSQALTGDGSAVYADLGSALIPATADFELEFCYFQVAVATVMSVFGQNGFNLFVNFDGASATPGTFVLSVLGGYSASGSISAGNNWIKVTRVGNLFSVYINGILQTSRTAAGSIGSATSTQILRRETGVQYSSGRISNFSITTGGVTKTFVFPGPGSSNTCRDIYWIASDNTYGKIANAVKNGTIATINANLCPGYAKNPLVLYGGRIGSLGERVPAVPNGSICADGSAVQYAGPTLRLCPKVDFNPALAAEFNGRSIPTAWVYGDGFGAAISPTDSAYEGDGEKYLIYEAALTGSDKTNVTNYVGA